MFRFFQNQIQTSCGLSDCSAGAGCEVWHKPFQQSSVYFKRKTTVNGRTIHSMFMHVPP